MSKSSKGSLTFDPWLLGTVLSGQAASTYHLLLVLMHSGPHTILQQFIRDISV